MKINPSVAEASSTKVSGVYRSIHRCTLKTTFYLWDCEEKNKIQPSQHE
jgi:hypothetical protein